MDSFERLDENEHDTPTAGTWRITWRGKRIAPCFGCPNCGVPQTANVVSPSGHVDGTVFCRCGWWGYVHLDQWSMIREVYGASVTDSNERTNAPDRPDLSHMRKAA